jgi:hypothetical protein
MCMLRDRGVCPTGTSSGNSCILASFDDVVRLNEDGKRMKYLKFNELGVACLKNEVYL